MLTTIKGEEGIVMVEYVIILFFVFALGIGVYNSVVLERGSEIAEQLFAQISFILAIP